MKPLHEFKIEFVEKCRNESACEDEFKRLLKSETPKEILEVIKDNIGWCFEQKTIETETLLEAFTVDQLNEVDIYISGNHSLVSNGLEIKRIVLLGNSQATVETLGNSQATVETWGNSQATVETRGNSQATVETRDNSQATVETRDNSQATVKTWGNSQATVETWGNSQATVETWGNSQATVETWGNSQATLHPENGGLIQDRNKKKIFIKKSDYEIVLID